MGCECQLCGIIAKKTHKVNDMVLCEDCKYILEPRMAREDELEYDDDY